MSLLSLSDKFHNSYKILKNIFSHYVFGFGHDIYHLLNIVNLILLSIMFSIKTAKKDDQFLQFFS